MLFIFCLDSVNNYIIIFAQSKFNYSMSSVNFIKCVYTKKQELFQRKFLFFLWGYVIVTVVLSVLRLCFFLGISVIIDCIRNRDDDQQPDEKTDRSGEEYAKASVCCGYRLDKIVLKVFTKDETDQVAGCRNLDLAKDITNHTEDEQCPYIEDTAILGCICANDTDHDDNRVHSLTRNVNDLADPLDRVEHADKHQDVAA